MKKFVVLCLLILLNIFTLYAQNISWEWAKQIKATSISSKSDETGNIYVTGAFDSTLTIGNITLTENSTVNFWATTDVFVAKFDPQGNVIWAKSFSGNDTDAPQDITLDDNGNCILIGEYLSQTITFDNFILHNLNSSPLDARRDIFITKLDPTGNVVWAKTYGSFNSQTYAKVVKSDLNGNCYAMGLSSGGAVAFGDHPYNYEIWSLNSDNSGNLFAAGGFTNVNGKNYVAKWDGSNWSELGGSNSSTFNNGIMTVCSDAIGNVYAAGSFTNANGKRYVAKWNGSGWSELGGNNSSTFNSSIKTITIDAGGNVYAAGYFTNANGKYFVAKWNGSNWSELGGANTSTFNNIIMSIKPDALGNIYAAGYFTNTNGKRYVAKWNGSNWSELGGTNTSTFPANIWSITTDALGNVYAGGDFANTNGNFYIAKWNGVTWSELGGTNSSILYPTGTYGICAITADVNGNIYTTGGFLNANSSNYVAKWNGNYWSELGGVNSSPFGYNVNGINALTIDIGGNVNAAGAFMNTNGNYYVAKWNGNNWSELGGKLIINGQGEFIVKLDNLGNPLFAIKTFAETKNFTLDNYENIFISGQFAGGPLNFGNSVICCSGQIPDVNMFFAKYDANGEELWARSAGYFDGVETGTAIDIDINGNIIVAGSYNSSNFYGLSVLSGFVGTSINDLFIAKHDSIGNLIWVEALKSQLSTGVTMKTVGDITTDNYGNCYIAGSFGEGGGGAMYLDNITLSSTSFSANGDAFVAKYDGNGNALFAVNAIGDGDDGALDISLDNLNNIYISGLWGYDAGGPITFGNFTLVEYPGFVAKLGYNSLGVTSFIDEEEDFYDIYPNPFLDYTTINFNEISNYSIKVYDVIGNLIKCYNISDNLFVLDMNESADGTYLLVIEDKDQLKSEVKKIVIN